MPLTNTQCRILLTVVLKCVDVIQQTSDIEKFLDSMEVLPISGDAQEGFLFAVSRSSELFIFNFCGVHFTGQDNLLGGQFWKTGRLNLLGERMNLLGG